MSLEDVLRHLSQRGLRITPQRRWVLEVLHNAPVHALSAEEIFERVRQHHPYVDISTVYRALTFFHEQGVVVMLQSHGAATRYEYVRPAHAHHHAVCRQCGATFEFTAPEVEALAERLRTTLDFEPDLTHLVVDGVCTRCRQMKRESHIQGGVA